MAAPRIVAQQGLQVAPAGARLSAADLGGGIGAALVDLGDGASQLAVRQAAANEQAARAQRLGDLRVQAMQDLGNLRLKYANDRDPGTMATRWGSEADALLDGYKQKNGDDPIWGAFSQDFKQLRIRDQVDVQTDAAKGLATRGQASLDSNIDALGQMLGQTDDPVRSGQIKDLAAAALVDAVDHGYIDEVKAGELQRKFVSKGDEARARILVTTNPEAAAAKLADGKAFPDLDDVKRTQLLDMATRRVDSLRSDRIRLAEKADRDADKALTKAGEKAASDLWQKNFDGELMLDDVEAAKPLLSVSEYRALRTALADPGEAKADDPQAVINLDDALGTPELKSKVADAMANRLITTATGRSYLDKNRSITAPDPESRPAPAYQSGRDFVKQTLTPAGLLLGDDAAKAAAAGTAQALVEYDNWASENPQASRKAALDKANEIIGQYSTIKLQDLEPALGLPRFYQGARETMTNEDLGAAEAKVIGDFQGGAMSILDRDVELQKIARWRAALQYRAQLSKPKEGTQ